MALKKSTIWMLVAVIFIATVFTYPAYRKVRLWRASSMAMEAETMLTTAESRIRAWELAHAARALEPNDLAIARTLARVYTAGDPVSAHPFWERVVELSAGSPADRLELVRAYLHAGLWQEFESELTAQRQENLHLPQLEYLEALAATRQGNYEQALQIVSALVNEEGAPHEADALFFQLSRIFPDSTIRRTGIDHLWTIGEGDGPRRRNALKTLALLPDLTNDDISRLIDAITNLGDDNRATQLLAEELRLRLPETDRSVVYSQASSLFDLDDAAEKADFGRWLNRSGLHDYTRTAIPISEAMRRQDLFLILADAMALNGEWEEIRKMLDQQRVPLEDYLREFFRMRTFLETGDLRRARLAWERALLEADRENPKLYYLAEKARQLGLPEFEIAALQRVIESPDMRRRAFDDLISVLQQQGKTADLHATLLKYCQFFTADREAESDILYLGFLIGNPHPLALEKAQAMLEAQPDILAYRMTVVMGLLAAERSAEALELLMELPVNWFEVRDRWRLLAALALHRSGFHADAQALAERTDPANLLPEEQRFLMEIGSADSR